jgi:hypothetical protein
MPDSNREGEESVMPDKNELDRFERAIVMTAIWGPGAVAEFIANQNMPLFERFWTAGSALNLIIGLVVVELINRHRRKQSKPQHPIASEPCQTRS